MPRIYYTANPRDDFNEWDADHSGSGLRCCICGQEIRDTEAICWQEEYAHVDEDCAYELWLNRIKDDLKEMVE